MLPVYADVTKTKRGVKRAAPGDNIRLLLTERGTSELEKCMTKLAAELTAVDSGDGLECALALSRAVTSDGYIQLSGGQVRRPEPITKVSGKRSTTHQVNIYAHHLVVWARDREEGILKNPYDTISHLCHRTDCLKSEHLIKEPIWVNIKRKYCEGPATCTCDPAHKCLRAPSDE